MLFWSGHCLVHMSLHSVRGVAIGAEKGGGRVLLEKQQLFWAGHCLVWSVLHKDGNGYKIPADTRPAGRGFGSGFVPAGAGTGTTLNPTGIS